MEDDNIIAAKGPVDMSMLHKSPDKVGMDQEVLETWIAELRKPELKQGEGYLCFVEPSDRSQIAAECCLGVLARLRGCSFKVDGSHRVFFRLMGEDAAVYGVEEGLAYATQDLLANLNDEGLTFSEIADLLEASKVELMFGGTLNQEAWDKASQLVADRAKELKEIEPVEDNLDRL